jgi:hypothetical protein
MCWRMRPCVPMPATSPPAIPIYTRSKDKRAAFAKKYGLPVCRELRGNSRRLPSETFPSRGTARRAAERVVGEQRVAGNTTGISYEDECWHDELANGRDRPITEVKG